MVRDRWISLVGQEPVVRIPNEMQTYHFYTKLNTRNEDKGAYKHPSVPRIEFLVSYDPEEFKMWRPLR